jgi:hypothetical protein
MKKLSIALVGILMAAPASAGPFDIFQAGGPEARVILAGHDNVDVPPAIPRYSGTVTAVGPKEGERVASFKSSITDFELNEVKSWRLTILSGELLGTAFVVLANTADEITVTDDGSLEGLAPGDLFVLEQVFTRRIIRIQ